MPNKPIYSTFILIILLSTVIWSQESQWQIHIPQLLTAPTIDGDLAEWKTLAFTDGSWDIHRVRHTPWFETERNRLTDHGNETNLADDLQARYYMAWDEKYLYLGAEVHDNVNDVDDPQHQASRWYFKDCIAWFIEAPHDDIPEAFGQGGNGFCFVIDPSKPTYGAWWRHGTPDTSYVEEPLLPTVTDYEIRMNPWGQSPADFILEARVEMAATLGVSDPMWSPPKVGDVYGLSIVHTDPDGGAYGGHLIIYGIGRNDGYWAKMVLTEPSTPIQRLKE